MATPTPSTPLTAWATLAAAILAAPPAAIAQDSAQPVSHLVTTVDDAPLRSGADLAWYVVATLEKDTVLRTTGEVDGWFRVEYPEGLPAVVRTVEARLDASSATVQLTRNSPLRAFNMNDPFMEDCYKRLFPERQLALGATLEYVGPVRNRRGETAGYKVRAPEGAAGFILPANVRPATPGEIRAFEGTPPAEDRRPARPTGTPEPEPTPTTEAPPTTDTPAADASTTDAPVAEPQPEIMETPAPARRTPRQPRTEFERTLDDLDFAYQRVMNEDIETAEFGQLIREYQSLRRSVPTGEEGAVERAYIDTRIELLEIRAQLQESIRELAALEAETARAEEGLDEFVRRVQAARGYAVVGTLSPSIIYDGKRLPRLYRVVSVDAAAGGRTLAYVLPNAELDLVGKLGRLVGIMGDDDPTARRGEVRVIRPTTVDILTTN